MQIAKYLEPLHALQLEHIVLYQSELQYRGELHHVVLLLLCHHQIVRYILGYHLAP